MVYVITVSVIQVSGPDVLGHYSICYTGFRSRWFVSLQYLLYSFQVQMVCVISVSVIQVSGPDGMCTLFYLECEVDDNE